MDIKNRRYDSPPSAGSLRFINDDGQLRALDSNGRVYRLRPEAGTPVNAVAASATIDPTGNDNSIAYAAKVAGVAGNGISVQYVISGTGSAVLSVAVSGGSIVVTAGSATTAQSVITAVNASAAAAALVTAAASGTVTGVIAAVAETRLSGGVDATEGSAGDEMFDETNFYRAVSHVSKASTSGWRKVAHSAL